MTTLSNVEPSNDYSSSQNETGRKTFYVRQSLLRVDQPSETPPVLDFNEDDSSDNSDHEIQAPSSNQLQFLECSCSSKVRASILGKEYTCLLDGGAEASLLSTELW